MAVLPIKVWTGTTFESIGSQQGAGFFYSASAPYAPSAGDFWFDTTNNVIKIYNGSAWQAIPGIILSATAPSPVSTGTMWFDTTNSVIRIYDGTAWQRLIAVSNGQVGINGNPTTGVSLTVSSDASEGLLLLRGSADATGNTLRVRKARGSSASPSVVSSGDRILNIPLMAHDGTNYITAAAIIAEVDGTPGTNDMPGRLVFSTTADGASAPTERMRISNTGQVFVGTTSAQSMNGTTAPALQVAGGASGQISVGRYSSDANPPRIQIGKSRNATIGSHTVVQSGDYLGSITWNGSDGTAFIEGAQISAIVDATPGTNDMPTALTFSTTVDGSSGATERMRITNAGNVGIGTTSPVLNLDVSSDTSTVVRVSRNTTDQPGPIVRLDKRRGTAASPTIVASGDVIGQIDFYAYDGAANRQASSIAAVVDGAPGSGDMPSRLTFWTTPDGTVTISERMRIDNAGLITGTGTSLGAWTSYTPTLGGTGWAIGNGTAFGNWAQIGKLVFYRINITFGSTSTFGGSALTLSLPTTAKSANQNTALVRTFDASTGTLYFNSAFQSSTTVISPAVTTTDGAVSGYYTTTAPFAWANGDSVQVSGVFEAA